MNKNLQSPFQTRQYMVSNDFEIYYYDDTQFTSVQEHSHSFFEFYFFLQGSISMYINDTLYTLKPGDIILLPPDIPHHTICHNKKVPYQRFVFWINADFFQQLQTRSVDYTYIANQMFIKQQYIYHNDMITFNSLQAKLFQLIEEIHGDRFGRSTKLGLCIEDLILQINRISYEANHPQSLKAKQTLYENLIQYMEEHLDEELSLNHLADVFYVSKYHIAHIFKENLGLSVHQYITKKRLAKCRDALLSDLNISKTFLLYGFKDYSSFYRAFKKEYGLSPKAYKESQLQTKIEETLNS